MDIRGVIFDYGGVLWDMRWDVTIALEQQHGLRERALVETLYRSQTWRQLEVGVGDRQAWLQESHETLEALAGRTMPRLHEEWRGQQRLIPRNIELVKRIRPPYRTAVLSNADKTLARRLREHGIHDLFDDIVVSADVGMAKPDPRIYALAAERLALPLEACVFIDDLDTNVEAARQAGMHGVHFRIDEGHDLEQQLSGLGVRPGG
ncbi:MAG: HAD family phosphatase [Dehalococcoidia bacterium]